MPSGEGSAEAIKPGGPIVVTAPVDASRLASWLVAEGLIRLRAAGARSASLYVDGLNETRAFDAYRKLGFELAFETEVWEASFQ